MPKIGVVDEEIINSQPSEVFKCSDYEFAGSKSWWRPLWEAKPRGEVHFSQLGGIIDVVSGLEFMEDKTKVKFRFNVKTNKLLFTTVSTLVNTVNIHSLVTQKGFLQLTKYLRK